MICLECGKEMIEYPKGWGCPGCDNYHIKDGKQKPNLDELWPHYPGIVKELQEEIVELQIEVMNYKRKMSLIAEGLKALYSETEVMKEDE